MSDLQVRGMGLAAMRAFLKERFGADGWARLLAHLPSDHREAIWEALILPTGWYPNSQLDAFLDTIEHVFRREEPRLGFLIGQRIAEGDIKFYHSLIMPFLNPGTVLSKVSRLWHEYYNQGHMEVVDRTLTSVRVVLQNPGVHPMLCREMIPGWGAKAVTVTRSELLRVEHISCARDDQPTCEYVVEWR